VIAWQSQTVILASASQSEKCQSARISDVRVMAREQRDLGELGFCLRHPGWVEIFGVTNRVPTVSLRERQGEPRLLKRSSIDETERDLITSLYPSLRRIAAVAGAFDVEPDDLVQEALAQTLRRGPISGLDNPLAFLRKTIVNLASNQRRSLGRKRKAVGRLPTEESWSPSYPADIEAILDLPPRQRAILYLVGVEDVPYAEAAEQLGVTTEAARMLANRARKRARAALEVAGD
jgi:RNA polymerase sigma factor (sigma-70 family)